MKLLDKIIQKWFCSHEWEERKLIEAYDNDNSIIPHTIHYIYICKKCGKIKIIKITGT